MIRCHRRGSRTYTSTPSDCVHRGLYIPAMLDEHLPRKVHIGIVAQNFKEIYELLVLIHFWTKYVPQPQTPKGTSWTNVV
jgi:hypothetical protein